MKRGLSQCVIVTVDKCVRYFVNPDSLVGISMNDADYHRASVGEVGQFIDQENFVWFYKARSEAYNYRLRFSEVR